MLFLFSSFVLTILIVGYLFRRRRQLHITLMSTAFALDVGLVLWIEIQRHAVEQLVMQQVTPFVWFHASVSLIVLLLYGVLIFLGINILKNNPWAWTWHKRVAVAFALCRCTNYITSFWLG